MRIAIPLADGKLAMHFGHCEEFALLDVDEQDGGAVAKTERAAAPPHQPGLLPQWLQEQGADLVICGGMGRRAQALFAQNGIDVVVGAPVGEPEQIARSYIAGELTTGPNVCDH
ncbi:MAG: NifB/NifX family molybdenum-iron cluster-binding protein [Planctomycetota bacterium]